MTTKLTTRLSKADPSSWHTFDLLILLPFCIEGSLCLDIGCGPGARQDLQNRGYRYIGLDRFEVPAADVIADAATLPFVNDSIDLVIAASSFEHFPDPWKAALEIARTLKPGGYAVVSLSFLEPYHAQSHFHMSHLGANKLFTDVGLVVEEIHPFEWTGIEAAVQALYRLSLARWLTGLVVKSTLWCRKIMINLLIRIIKDPARKQRAQEFLREEEFRFTAGIKLRLRKPA